MESSIAGLLITIFADQGPVPLVNLSPLEEVQIYKLSILGMTIINMGDQTLGQALLNPRLHGPIPIPNAPEYEALSMSFNVKATETKDERIQRYGRSTTFWLIFDIKYRDAILSNHHEIERALKEEIKDINREIDLEDEQAMEAILTRLQKLSAKEPATTPVETAGEVELEPEQFKAVQFYTVDRQGELKVADLSDHENLVSNPMLIVVNSIVKKIFVIKNRDDVPNRLVFLASRAASGMNAQRWKNEFYIRDISDPLERDLLLDQIRIFLQEQ